MFIFKIILYGIIDNNLVYVEILGKFKTLL